MMLEISCIVTSVATLWPLYVILMVGNLNDQLQ